MKGKGSRVVQHIIAKCRAMKAKIMVTALTVLYKKETISAKVKHAVDGILNPTEDERVIIDDNDHYDHKHQDDNDEIKAAANDDDDKYPDLRHTLFDEEIAHLLDESASSAIDIVKNTKQNFNLEDEIDEVADLFITKFHRRMRLQKLLSFKRHQQMLMGGNA
ncbi:hypothetical protein STAS_15833 [Striga asiatica]|uniref:Uncharacterized protein n=1 Tax=Striga asiatica TaxID=4170 RepID=A0A5A7Q292_STRAF|nr:hypothetical protein STAS_15833 [Striga asiatica]